MRLIDADALMVQMVEGPYNCPGDCGCCDPDRDLKIDSKTAFGCSAIIHAPTIDAIPVEWMVSWINRHPNDLRCVWFASLEMEWQKEQEAR